jgi:hypothetical protein
MSDERSMPFTIKGESLLLKVKAFPKAEGNRIVGVRSGELVVRVRAPATKGKANTELVRFLSKRLSVPRTEVRILSGHSSRHKLILLPRAAGAALGEAL